MSLNIDIDVANLAVARLKCMLENWDKLASAYIYISNVVRSWRSWNLMSIASLWTLRLVFVMCLMI